jgi:hypothetical protein
MFGPMNQKTSLLVSSLKMIEYGDIIQLLHLIKWREMGKHSKVMNYFFFSEQALHMLGKWSTSALHPQTLLF